MTDPTRQPDPTRRPFACPRCGSQVAIVEMVTGYLDWGPAVLGADGVVRPAIHTDPPVVAADNSTTSGLHAVCDSTTCGYRWKLRRRFDAESPVRTSGGGGVGD